MIPINSEILSFGTYFIRKCENTRQGFDCLYSSCFQCFWFLDLGFKSRMLDCGSMRRPLSKFLSFLVPSYCTLKTDHHSKTRTSVKSAINSVSLCLGAIQQASKSMNSKSDYSGLYFYRSWFSFDFLDFLPSLYL